MGGRGAGRRCNPRGDAPPGPAARLGAQGATGCGSKRPTTSIPLIRIGLPPLALAWVNSHQDDKFPGEPPTPAPFVTGANEAADATTKPRSDDPSTNGRAADTHAGIRWPPGLPRFWISHRRRAPPGGVGSALQAWLRERTQAEWGAASRPWEGALGRSLSDLYTNTLPLQLYTQVALPAGAWVGAAPPASGSATTPAATGPRVINLEGFVARLRGYVGGSFTQLLHRQPALEAHIREVRTRAELTAEGETRDLIEAIVHHDFDLAEVDLAIMLGRDQDALATHTRRNKERDRCCPWEWEHVLPRPRTLAGPATLTRCAGSTRHAAL